MKINTKIIKKLNPCIVRFNNYLQHYSDFNGTIEDFTLLDKITYDDKIWVITKLLTKKQNVKFAIKCATSVLSIFEKMYPNDKRPRLALEASEAWLNSPTEKNVDAARAAAYATVAAAIRATAAAYAADAAAYAADAADAAYAADAADAAYAAYAADAADAADAAAYAADAADAAYAAAAAAAAAAAYARAADARAADAAIKKKSQQELNLKFAVEVANEQFT